MKRESAWNRFLWWLYRLDGVALAPGEHLIASSSAHALRGMASTMGRFSVTDRRVQFRSGTLRALGPPQWQLDLEVGPSMSTAIVEGDDRPRIRYRALPVLRISDGQSQLDVQLPDPRAWIEIIDRQVSARKGT